MKISILLVSLLLALSAISRVSAQAEPSPSASPASATSCPMCGADSRDGKDDKAARPADDDETTLKQLEQDWGEAIARNQIDVIERTEADEFTYTSPDGIVGNKAEQLAQARLGAITGISFQYTDLKTHVYGETAVVTGRCTEKWADGDKQASGDYRFTDTFVKRGGRWQAVASQATAIGKTQSPSEN